MELNGRQRGSPWSLRQTGVYQRYDPMTHQSKWILLQPSDYMRGLLTEVSDCQSGVAHVARQDPFYLHAFFLSASERNSADWLDSIQQEIQLFVFRPAHFFPAAFADTFKDEKACNCNLDKKQEHDYEVIFADYQRLQSLRTMLSRYKSVLNSQYRIAHACGELSEKMHSSGALKVGILFDTIIHLAKIHRHQEKLEILSWQASSIVQMVRSFNIFTWMMVHRHTVIKNTRHAQWTHIQRDCQSHAIQPRYIASCFLTKSTGEQGATCIDKARPERCRNAENLDPDSNDVSSCHLSRCKHFMHYVADSQWSLKESDSL